MISRARLKTLEAAASRIASRPHGEPDIEALLAPEERAFFAAREGKPADEWTLDDRRAALQILEKYAPPASHGSHGNGLLPNCRCGLCEHYTRYHEHQQSLNGGKATSC